MRIVENYFEYVEIADSEQVLARLQNIMFNSPNCKFITFNNHLWKEYWKTCMVKKKFKQWETTLVHVNFFYWCIEHIFMGFGINYLSNHCYFLYGDLPGDETGNIKPYFDNKNVQVDIWTNRNFFESKQMRKFYFSISSNWSFKDVELLCL